MNLNDLQRKARTALYRPKKSTMLQRWGTNARQLKDEFERSKQLVGDYLGLNRPIVLN